MSSTRDVARRVAAVSGIVGASVGAASALGSLGAASYFARVLLTPERDRPDDVCILSVDDDTITLDLTENTVQPGRYGLWFDGGAGHLRLGDITALDAVGGTVVRTLVGVDGGRPAPGPARWNSSYYAQDPRSAFGVTTHDVHIASDVGDLTAWLVPGEPTDGRWAVLVHGRGATRHECLRAVPTLHDLGLTCLIPTYRNDPDGPPSPDGRYNLGLSEWRDIDAVLEYALAAGARELVLVGWSMGGAIVLQTLDLSPRADAVSGVVLDGPVVDWGDVIAHHARLRRVPRPLAALAETLIGAWWGKRLVGVHETLDVARTNWQHRSGELRHPMLVVHSVADDFVPVGPSAELARRRPDLVRLETWPVGRHVREWNVDPGRWERLVGDFVTALSPAVGAAAARPPD